MQIAIYGGTFDPFHNGHLAVARYVRDKTDTDKVLVIPAGKPYLRPRKPSASPNARLEMCQLAVKDEPDIAVSDIEVINPGNSYTIETLNHLQATYGHKTHFTLVLGADTISSIKQWHRPDDLWKFCSPIVIRRPGTDFTIPPNMPSSTRIMVGPECDISGTQVRRAYANGDLQAARNHVPPSVHRFIISEELYWCVPTT